MPQNFGSCPLPHSSNEGPATAVGIFGDWETIIRLFAFFNSLDVASIAAKTTIPSFLYLEISGYV